MNKKKEKDAKAKTDCVCQPPHHQMMNWFLLQLSAGGERTDNGDNEADF